MRCLLSRFLGQWNESGWKSINHMSSEGWKKPLFRVSRFYYPAAIEQIKWYFRREKQAQQAADSTLPAAIPKQQQRGTTLPLLLACEQQWKNVKILFLGPCSTNIRFLKRFLKQNSLRISNLFSNEPTKTAMPIANSVFYWWWFQRAESSYYRNKANLQGNWPQIGPERIEKTVAKAQ